MNGVRVARLRSGGSETYGVVEGGRVATREDIMYQTGVPVPLGLKEFAFGRWPEEVARVGVSCDRSMDDFEVMAPIASPPKIICLAFNYADHAAEQGRHAPEEPVIVLKPRTALTGARSKIRCPDFVKQLDYEIELAAVIGRTCRDVSENEAAQAVAGYMVFNDVSARDVQLRDGQFGMAKGMDTFAPCGPWITTADEVKDPQKLKLATRVNGQLRQDSSTSMMRLGVMQVVSKISRAMTLERGDIIATGTPSGVALGSAELGFLKDGDVVDMEIEGLGGLSNTVQLVRTGGGINRVRSDV